MGGWLSVRDDHDLAIACSMAGEDPAREHQAVLEVCPVLVAVPRELGQGLGSDLTRVVREADHGEVVARELGPDERVQRDSNLLGRHEAAAQEHGAAHVHEQDGRCRCQLLGPEDFEVRWAEVDGPTLARSARVLVTRERVPQRAVQLEVERIAELVGFGGLVTLAATPRPVDPVAAERVAAESCKQVIKHLLADPPGAARSQLQALAVACQVPRLLEAPGQVVQRIEVANGLVVHEVA